MVGAVARRDGAEVVVTWRTNRAAPEVDQYVSATAGRDAVARNRRGPRRWRARVPDVESARSISVFVVAEDLSRVRRAAVRVQ